MTVPDRARENEPSSLRSPVLWGAVVVLLVNDHLLKGSGLVPGVITGKLSDFSWLIVAPVILGALLGGRRVLVRSGIVAFFAGLFLVTELSQPAADQVSAFFVSLGIPCRLWADPTDLIALSVLPIAWHVMAQSKGTTVTSRLDRALSRSALAVGIFASIATSAPPTPAGWNTGAYVVNHAGGAIEVRVRWTTAAIDCAALTDADLGRAVSGVIFEDAITYRLDPDETVPLERGDRSTPGVAGSSTGMCQLAMVAVDGASDTIVLVPPSGVFVPTTGGDTLDVPTRAVEVVLDSPGFGFAFGSDLNWSLRDDRAHATDCTGVRPAFDVSSSMVEGADQVILEVAMGTDGCTSVRTDDGARTFLCVPAELVPFQVGESFRNDGNGRFTGQNFSLRVARASGTRAVTAGPFTLAMDPLAETCEGIRLSCGAFSYPHAVTITGVGTVSDAFASSPAGSVAIGRSQSVVIAPMSCDAAHSALGNSFDYAVLLPR